MSTVRKPPVIVMHQNTFVKVLEASWKTLLVLSVASFLVAFGLGPGGFSAVIASHAMLYAGFALCLLADRLSRRPFNKMRFFLLLVFWVSMAVGGPIIKAAG